MNGLIGWHKANPTCYCWVRCPEWAYNRARSARDIQGNYDCCFSCWRVQPTLYVGCAMHPHGYLRWPYALLVKTSTKAEEHHNNPFNACNKKLPPANVGVFTNIVHIAENITLRKHTNNFDCHILCWWKHQQRRRTRPSTCIGLILCWFKHQQRPSTHYLLLLYCIMLFASQLGRARLAKKSPPVFTPGGFYTI